MKRAGLSRLADVVKARWLPLHGAVGVVVTFAVAVWSNTGDWTHERITFVESGPDTWVVRHGWNGVSDRITAVYLPPLNAADMRARVPVGVVTTGLDERTPRVWERYPDQLVNVERDLYAEYESIGWPARCLEMERVKCLRTRLVRSERGVLSVRGMTIPAAPLYGGIAVNGLVFTAGSWLLHLGGAAVGRAWRRNYARMTQSCHGCGYDRKWIAAGSRCPECGAGPP